jgi:hypothetical protein
VNPEQLLLQRLAQLFVKSGFCEFRIVSSRNATTAKVATRLSSGA